MACVLAKFFEFALGASGLKVRSPPLAEIQTEALPAEGPLVASHQSAIDRDALSGHVIRQIGAQEFDDLGAILDRSQAP